MKKIKQEEVRRVSGKWYVVSLGITLNKGKVVAEEILNVFEGPFETREEAEIALYGRQCDAN